MTSRTRLVAALVAGLLVLGCTTVAASAGEEPDPCAGIITDSSSTAQQTQWQACRLDRIEAGLSPVTVTADPVTVTETATQTATVTATQQVPTTVTAPPVTVTSTVTAAPTSTTSASSTPTTPPVTSSSAAPSSTSAPTPTAPAAGLNCAPNPSACGYPDATNTGAKGTLKKVPSEVTSGTGWTWQGSYIRASSGAVLDGLELTGADISVEGNNVTIRNVKINGYGEGWGIAIRHATNTLIEDVTIAPVAGKDRLMVGIKDIYADSQGTMIRRVNIAGTSTGVQMESGTLRDSYIHDMGIKSGDHINGFTSNGGTTLLTIQHNTIFNQIAQTDAVSLFQDFGAQKNRVIDNNLLAGGGYTVYGGANVGKEANATDIRITNNRISRVYFPQGGSYGWLAAWNPNGAGNVLSGNVWDDTGAPIN